MKRDQLCNYIEIRTANSFRLGKKVLHASCFQPDEKTEGRRVRESRITKCCFLLIPAAGNSHHAKRFILFCSRRVQCLLGKIILSIKSFKTKYSNA